MEERGGTPVPSMPGANHEAPNRNPSETHPHPPHLSARLYRDLFRNAPIGIFLVQEGKLKYVNPEFLEIGGYYEEELLEMAAEEIVHPDDWPMVKENAAKMLKGSLSHPYMYRALDKTGEILWIIESVTSVEYEGKRATLGFFMDVTEGERAKEALRLSEEKFAKAFRSSPDWFVISTLEDGFYIDVNETFLEVTGYRREEVIGRTSLELGIWVNPADRRKAVQELRQSGILRNVEVQFRMKSGEIRDVLWSGEVIQYGDEVCVLAMSRDITHRKHMEQERLHREKVQGVLETAGAACHELNQPLQFAFYLADEIMKEHPRSEAAVELKKQLERLREITNKLDGITSYRTTEYIQGSQILDIHEAGD